VTSLPPDPPPAELAPAQLAPVDLAPGDLPPGDLPPADRDGWRRLHKVTPVLKGWKVVAVALVIVGQQRGDELITGDAVPSRVEVLITLGVLAALAVAASVWAYLSWRMTRFRVDGEVLQLHSGVLFRQQRQARLDRLQAVDVVQPLLGRVFGLSELKLEVAGGAGSDVKLAYLRDAEAQRLRGVLLAQAAGLTYEGDEAPEAPEQELLQVPVPRLLGSLLLSGGTVGAVVVLVGAVVASVLHPAALFGAIPAVLGAASAYWAQFTLGFGFRVAASPDGLRLRHGLLETRAQTVPPGRVQAVRLVQPLLWRRRDWWKVEVNVAGYGVSGDGQQKETVLLPVGTRGEAFTVLSVVLPDLGHPEPLRLLEAGLTGLADEQGLSAGYTCAPRSSRWLDPIGWRRHGVAVTERALVLRSGRLRRALVLVPHERTQSLGLEQGPVQRRLGLATVVAHSTPGPVAPRIDHLAADVAGRLLDEQAERARVARATSGPERWMQRAPAPAAGPHAVDLVKPTPAGDTASQA
jgi:putative membrane protein